MSIAEALPALHQRALATMTSRAPCPVGTYLLICRTVAASNLEAEDSEPVRRRFNAYYGVRRNTAWRSHFYARFEVAKGSSLTPAVLFEDVLAGIHADTGRVEASFASKLVATLRPESPIIDSVVRGWLSQHGAAPHFGGGLQASVDYFAWLAELMGELAASPQAQAWGEAFQETFPTPEGEAPVSAMKQLDFLIWAGAER